MYKSKVLVSFIILLCMLFVVFHFNGSYWKAEVARSFIIPFITVLYLIKKKDKSAYFTLFLVAFSLSDILSLFSFNVFFDLSYYIGNSLYIVAYLALTYEIILSIKMKHIFNHFKLHVLVLIFLNIYANYVLLEIEQEFVSGLEIGIELAYNIFTLLLLSVSLLNYLYRDDNKAFILFLGSLCIVVSEVIQIAYFYISDNSLLNVSYSLLLILAFIFYYIQSKLEYDELFVMA